MKESNLSSKILLLKDKYPDNAKEISGWNEKSPIKLERLAVVEVDYWDFNYSPKKGELIVLDIVANNVAKIFEELREIKFPIASVKLLHDWQFNDEESMKANNSSSYNNRNIADSDKPSLHTYGLAIDINPVPNPYVFIPVNTDINAVSAAVIIKPARGINYLNRDEAYERNPHDMPNTGMILRNSNVTKIFKSYGFNVWGGGWINPIDYQHFDVGRNVAEKLVNADYDAGVVLWEEHVSSLIGLDT